MVVCLRQTACEWHRIMSPICQICSPRSRGPVGEGNGSQTRYRSSLAKEKGADETLGPNLEMGGIRRQKMSSSVMEGRMNVLGQ